ncbi:MAG: AAA family ATPase [Thermoprotei archaeon]|jgi:AAA+ superfamily predicted ATPase
MSKDVLSDDNIVDILKGVSESVSSSESVTIDDASSVWDVNELAVVREFVKNVIARGNLVIYEVENYENLFDYAELFLKCEGSGGVVLFDKIFKFIPVVTYPHPPNIRLYDNVMEILDANYAVPFLLYFVSDMVTSVDSADAKDLSRVLMYALFMKKIYAVLFTTNTVLLYDNIPVSRYGVRVNDIAPGIVGQLKSENAKYSSSIGFLKLFRMDEKDVKDYLANRNLPTPHTIDELTRDVTFNDLILPKSLRDFIKINVITPLKEDFMSIPSLVFIGPHGAGKTTLGYTLSAEIGIPSYMVRVELFASKWLGETERLANQTLMIANNLSPSLLVLKDAEVLLGKRTRSTGEEGMVYERVKAVISSWLRNRKRKFLIVFTISNPKLLPENILYDPTFGMYKLPVLPPMTKEERKTLLTIFIKKLAKIRKLTFDETNESINEALDTVSEETWSYTPRELYDIAKAITNITISDNTNTITKRHIQLSKRYKEIDRIARIEMIENTVNACKKAGLPEDLLIHIFKFENEIKALKAQAYAEEEKKRTFSKIIK